jgi:hypothetical protein
MLRLRVPKSRNLMELWLLQERQIHFHPSDESLVHIFGEEAHTFTESV